MKLLKLTSVSGKEFAFNTDLIVKVWNRDNGATILTADKDEMLVKETMEEIIVRSNKK